MFVFRGGCQTVVYCSDATKQLLVLVFVFSLEYRFLSALMKEKYWVLMKQDLLGKAGDSISRLQLILFFFVSGSRSSSWEDGTPRVPYILPFLLCW